ncbi:MAG: GIY-YIG nuclease family protein [Azospirillum sp.]|nr:GIY-YIG nuclease family protein [Azospirillum sp.]
MTAASAERWHVYVLLNDAGTSYVGSTSDPDRRLAAHNAGKGAKFTRGRGPWRLIHSETFATKGAALSREAALKKDHAFRRALKATWRDRRTP